MSDPHDRIRLVHNEQTKIRSTFYNTIAAGFVVAGIITPIATVSRGKDDLPGLALALILLCFLMAAFLHYAALKVLETLR